MYKNILINNNFVDELEKRIKKGGSGLSRALTKIILSNCEKVKKDYLINKLLIKLLKHNKIYVFLKLKIFSC